MSNEVTSIKLVTFAGKKHEWQNFERKFKAFLTAKKLKKAFAFGWVVPKKGDEVDQQGNEIADKVKEQELNETAYNLLLLSMDAEKDQGQVAFDLVTSTETPDYPDGNFPDAWKKLSEKYYPKNVTSMKEVEKDFNGMKLNKTKDPEVYFGKLQVLHARLVNTFGKTITKEELILRGADGLPKEYQPVKRWVERETEKGNPVTEADFINEMRSHFKFLNPKYGDSGEDNEEKETALVGVQGKKYTKPFKGKCNNCGVWGHMAKNCRNGDKSKSSNQSSSGKFDGNCRYCNIYGHKEADCRKKKRAESESASPAVDTGEVMLLGLEDIRPNVNWCYVPSDYESTATSSDSMPELMERNVDYSTVCLFALSGMDGIIY